MTITVSNVRKAKILADALDDTNQALAIVASGTFNQSLELSSENMSGVMIPLSFSASNLTTMLTNRKTAIQSQLDALGVT